MTFQLIVIYCVGHSDSDFLNYRNIMVLSSLLLSNIGLPNVFAHEIRTQMTVASKCKSQ